MAAQILPLIDENQDYNRVQQLMLDQQREANNNAYREAQLSLAQQRYEAQQAMNPLNQQLIQAQLEQHHAATREAIFNLNHAEQMAPYEEQMAQLKQQQGQQALAQDQWALQNEQDLAPLRKQNLQAQTARTQQEIDLAPGTVDRQNALADSQLHLHNAQMQEAIDKQLQTLDVAPKAVRGLGIAALVKNGVITQEEADAHMALPDQPRDTRNSVVEGLGEMAGIKFDSLREMLTKPPTQEDQQILRDRAMPISDTMSPQAKALLQSSQSQLTSREQALKGLEELLNARDAKLNSVLPLGQKKKLTSDMKDTIGAFMKAAGGDSVKARQLAIEKGWVVD